MMKPGMGPEFLKTKDIHLLHSLGEIGRRMKK